MATRDIFTDLTNLIHPLPPAPDPDASENERDAFSATADEAEHNQRQYDQNLRLSWDEGGIDPLLGEIAATRRSMGELEAQLRQLLAYGREFVSPRPYTLDELAEAAGMSLSGVRTAYNDHEIRTVASHTGANPRTRHTRSAS